MKCFSFEQQQPKKMDEAPTQQSQPTNKNETNPISHLEIKKPVLVFCLSVSLFFFSKHG